MAAYKTLNSQDIIISPLEVSKGFSFEGNALTASNVAIDRYLGNKFAPQESTGYITEYSQSAIYFQTQQLYYSNFVSSSNGNVQKANILKINVDGTTTGKIASNAFENFIPTDLLPQRFWLTSSYSAASLTGEGYGTVEYGDTVYGIEIFEPIIATMSIPRALFGDYIIPKSIIITTDSGSYFDDGEGRLQMNTPKNELKSITVGNVIYEHGIIVFTGGTRQEGTGESGSYGDAEYGSGFYGGRTVGNNDSENFVKTSNITCSFSSSFTIYETQYKCTIGESEFNYTLNPSMINSGSNIGAMQSFATESYFDPYVTTVGLYNNDQELLAVGKLAQPLPTSKTTDTTILVNIDRQ
jgi:hypothetical protein|tara:strand:- start:1840 stop:2901 length:1062 start_codon:yes stop_codon:yes gene_type:complete